MNSGILRAIAAAVGGFYGSLIYNANTHYGQDFSIAHYFVAASFLAYAIGSLLRSKWVKPS